MTRPRSQIVSLDETPYYHCVSRCVRRAWLCGEDSYSGKNFDHRKPWLLQRLALLAEVFAIDITAYAVMSNHYHVVLHVDRAAAETWDRDEVVRRWLCLHKGDPLVQRHLRGELRLEDEFRQLNLLVKTWRERLTSVSWFMRSMNEYIARRANREDDCTGRFWEGRFKSRALLDEAALLSCMAYVDLNPLRAGVCATLEEAKFSFIRQRVRPPAEETSGERRKTPKLMPFACAEKRGGRPATLPHDLASYIDLVEWTSRAGEAVTEPNSAPVLLFTLGLSGKQWRTLTLEIQQEAITMFSGLARLVARERRMVKKAA